MFFLLGWLWFSVKRSKGTAQTGTSTGFRGVGIGAVWLQICTSSYPLFDPAWGFPILALRQFIFEFRALVLGIGSRVGSLVEHVTSRKRVEG